MPKFDQYYIVEFRMPIKVESVSSVQEAVSRAKQMCENQFGFKPDNWNARVFEYSTGINITGHVKEYFYNPNSSHYREITKNMEYFNDLVKKRLKNLKRELLEEILLMENRGVDVYSYKLVRADLIRQNVFDLVEWLDNNREEFTTSILNREQHNIGFYYD